MVQKPKKIERGQSITFRVPSDTPDYLLKQLQRLREQERRNFSSEIAQFVLKGVNETYESNRETITIPLPKALTKEQKSWLKHEHSEALIGTILYQLLSDPMRATSLLASLNSNAPTIDEALYLQEDYTTEETSDQALETDESVDEAPAEQVDDALMETLDMSALFEDVHAEDTQSSEEDEDDDDPLGDFFANMNK